MAELRKLKARMVENGIDGKGLAALIGREPNYIYRVIRGTGDLRLSELYTISDYLDINLEDLPKFFPKKEA